MRPSEIPLTLSECLQIMPDFSQNLESLLSLYLTHPFDANTRLSICEKIAGLLRFLEPCCDTLDQFSHLTYAASPLGTSPCYDDVVGAIRCGGCAQAFLYRFLFLRGVGPGVQLYRIPGLGYSWLPPDSPNRMIRHVSEAHNHEFYSHFLLFSPTTKVPTIVQMPKVIQANSKAIRKSVEKAKIFNWLCRRTRIPLQISYCARPLYSIIIIKIRSPIISIIFLKFLKFVIRLIFTSNGNYSIL
jgi:hypothetical protein